MLKMSVHSWRLMLPPLIIHSSEELNFRAEARFDFLPTRSVLTAFGKSPSEHISVKCAVMMDENSPVWNTIKDYSDIPFPYILPGRSAEIQCPFVGPKSARPAHAPVTYVQLGIVEYQDGAGNRYQTPFCNEVGNSFPLYSIAPCNDRFGLPDLK